jgi:hypothetical protein
MSVSPAGASGPGNRANLSKFMPGGNASGPPFVKGACVQLAGSSFRGSQRHNCSCPLEDTADPMPPEL